MIINIPFEANYVLDVLKNNNFESYLVGGYVRDSLLGIKPKDFDITTNALPEDIISIFNKTIETGLKHGTVTAIINNIPIDITTFRIDTGYSDNRHPDNVIYTSCLKEDLSRRDFTINALAYNPHIGLIDIFHGKKHLEEKIIVAVGDADLRFNEDALRMLRCIRFATVLNFTIEHNTYNALCKNHILIKEISKERIRDEICKILLGPTPSKGFRLLYECGMLKYILPDLCCAVGFDQRNPHHDKNLFEHIMAVLDNSCAELKVRLAALFHDIGKIHCFSVDSNGIGHFYKHELISSEMAISIMKDLRFNNDIINDVSKIIKGHMTAYSPIDNISLKKLIITIGENNIYDLFQLQIADKKAHAKPHDFSIIFKNRDNTNKILEMKDPLYIKDLEINGSDLLALGFKQNEKIGLELERLLELVLANPSLNNKKTLIDLLNK